jgi:hypothetical protein
MSSSAFTSCFNSECHCATHRDDQLRVGGGQPDIYLDFTRIRWKTSESIMNWSKDMIPDALALHIRADIRIMDAISVLVIPRHSRIDFPYHPSMIERNMAEANV